jgi:phage terminase small subunit
MWNDTVPELDRLQLLKPIDVGVLIAYCLAWDQLVRAAN